MNEGVGGGERLIEVPVRDGCVQDWEFTVEPVRVFRGEPILRHRHMIELRSNKMDEYRELMYFWKIQWHGRHSVELWLSKQATTLNSDADYDPGSKKGSTWSPSEENEKKELRIEF